MPIKWTKKWISDENYESAGVFDVNNDGILDIVSGCWWYEGPDFKKKHFIGQVKQIEEYYDDFSTIPMDINGDGYLDYVTGGWWGNTLRWRENPGVDLKKQWTEHIIAETGNIETTRCYDVDNDENLEIIPNTPGAENITIFKLCKDKDGKGTGNFDKHIIYQFEKDKRQGHGLGCGDIAGNGRKDIVLSWGWLESPQNPFEGIWKLHMDFNLGCGSVPILVVDINKDGLNDIIVGQAHGYGLDWWEQKIQNNKRTWLKHPIDPYNAQYHDIQWVDIDGDGECELITGKRHRAHSGNDKGEWDDYGIYYFKWNGESFSKQVVCYGPIGKTKGVGLHFVLADLRKTGRLDIIAPGKDGLYVFLNEGL